MQSLKEYLLSVYDCLTDWLRAIYSHAACKEGPTCFGARKAYYLTSQASLIHFTSWLLKSILTLIKCDVKLQAFLTSSFDGARDQLYFPVAVPSYLLDMRLGGAQSRSGHSDAVRNTAPAGCLHKIPFYVFYTCDRFIVLNVMDVVQLLAFTCHGANWIGATQDAVAKEGPYFCLESKHGRPARFISAHIPQTFLYTCLLRFVCLLLMRMCGKFLLTTHCRLKPW